MQILVADTDDDDDDDDDIVDGVYPGQAQEATSERRGSRRFGLTTKSAGPKRRGTVTPTTGTTG